MIFLSVIVAAHNAEKTLNITLKSLLSAINDNNHDLEIIIINDNSQDNTQKIINSWIDKLPHVITEKVVYNNIGRVRNYAVSLATGKYITMLDSDDQLKAGSLFDAIRFLKIKRPDILLTHLLEVYDTNNITDNWLGFNPILLSRDKAIQYFLLHKNFQAHLIGQFIHRKLYIKNCIPDIVCYEDFAVFPNLLMSAETIFYQRKGHYYYIRRPYSIISTIDINKIILLIKYTLHMESIFPSKFKYLIGCHWLNIYYKHNHYLNDTLRYIISRHIHKLYPSWRHFIFSKISFNYKLKIFKVLWEK